MSGNIKTTSRRSLLNPIGFFDQAAIAAAPFLFLRQPSRPSVCPIEIETLDELCLACNWLKMAVFAKPTSERSEENAIAARIVFDPSSSTLVNDLERRM
jgi:hypothetical protein